MALTDRKFQVYLFIFLLLTLLLHSSQSTVVEAQEALDEADPVVEAIFNAFTPTERVGQLFMVSFNGTDVSSEADIAELIQFYRIGGVYLSAKNENFSNDQDTPAQILNLTNGLQALAQQPPVLTSTLTTTQVTAPSYTPLPLFVAIDHEGDGYPFTQIRNGLTDVPSQMAIGATWDTENAKLVGQVVGQELSALGINMLFGPSLDVLDNPRVDRGNSLGTRTFGGHPYWVGQMGEAYIRGIHQGSNHQVLTVVKHFPGFGGSDREIDQGVPTILKPLDELRRVELVPFFQVMRLNPNDPAGTTDGLMTAHIRYQGLQGSVPISLDARNLPTLLALKEVVPWRNAGGLVVSASLGAPAALEGIAAGRDTFPARRLAQDAFLAGSDILLLTNFASQNDPEAQLSNIKDAITFFQEKYASDPNFQTAVDARVKRIIKAKIKIYGRELPNDVAQRPEDALENIGSSPIDLNKLAQAGATLIAPVLQQGSRSLPPPPRPGENILIFTDTRLGQDCQECPEFPLIEMDALERIILQLFGPEATGQVAPEQITSRSFVNLKNFLAGQEPDRAEIETLIQEADWVIFAMLNVDTVLSPSSDAVTALLRNRPDALRNKNVILFAFNAPYFLGETEISQLTAFYGFYSKTRSYLETAARLLFQQFEPSGASPVSIPAIGSLDLSPDPNQLIELNPAHKINSDGTTAPLEDLAADSSAYDLEVGEGILFRTSTIMDRNGNPVPDGTVVNFFRFYPLEGLSLEPLQSGTNKGVAEIRIIKERDTPLQVRASSNLAVQSETFNIGPGIIDTPTPTATATPTPTDTPMPSSTPTETPTPIVIIVTPTPEPTATPTPPVLVPPPPPSNPVGMVDLLYSLLGMLMIGGIAFTLGNDRFALEDRVRSALVAIALGLVGYILYTIIAMVAVQSGYVSDLSSESRWIAPLISLIFAITGLLVWYLKPGRIFNSRIKIK